MPLSERKIQTVKPAEKAYKVFDERGLFLLVKPSGAKYWRMKYRFGGKEKLLAFGVYDDVTLADARNKRDRARNLLANGVDPGQMMLQQKEKLKLDSVNSFETIAREWNIKSKPKWTPKHCERIIDALQDDIFPWLGKKVISEITTPDMLSALRRIESRGAIESAHRTNQICSQVFRYAITTGRAERDPCTDLRGALPPVRKKHYASLTDKDKVGALIRAISGYEGGFITKCALQVASFCFVRPGELRNAEWSEINFAEAEWHIPAEKMKMRVKHIVPLSKQVITVLQELHPVTGRGKYLFPSERTSARPMSDNTVNSALRRMGYCKEEMTGHGFRSTASTLLNENGWNRDAIERQLAHAERDNIRAAYNYAEYLTDRRKMMQWWADFLDKLASDKG